MIFRIWPFISVFVVGIGIIDAGYRISGGLFIIIGTAFMEMLVPRRKA